MIFFTIVSTIWDMFKKKNNLFPHVDSLQVTIGTDSYKVLELQQKSNFHSWQASLQETTDIKAMRY